MTILRKQHFRLLEDGSEWTITDFPRDGTPASAGGLFDTCGSMQTKLQKLCQAAAAFLKIANPEDEFCLLKFAERAKLPDPFLVISTDLCQAILHSGPLKPKAFKRTFEKKGGPAASTFP